MNPLIWGPPTWEMIHTFAAGYPNIPTSNDKINVQYFYKYFSQILPCKNCKIHFQKLLDKYPLNDKILKNSQSLLKWTVDIHNKVNMRLGKPIYPFAMVQEKYKKQDMQCEIVRGEECEVCSIDINNQNYIMIILLIILIIIIYIYFKKKKQY
jgi:FAD-linked sulfhydryl oxidase